MHWSEGISELIAWTRTGLNLIIHSSDFRLVKDALSRDIQHLRAELGLAAGDTSGRDNTGRAVDI